LQTDNSVATRLALIERNTVEVMGRDDLIRLLEAGAPIKHYIGMEISGLIHLGTGLVCMSKVADFQRAGLKTSVELADWHTWINDKLGGDPDWIREVAGGYFTEGLKASLECVGGDPDAVDFVLGSDLYHHNDAYWVTLVEVSKNISLARVLRSISIMGRREGESVDFAKLLYPSMQVADIFIQGVTLAHAGLEQRKAHVIARDVALHLRTSPLRGPDGRPMKPIAVHHPIILGLNKPPVWPIPEGDGEERATLKMSKSQAGSAIFIHDSPEEIRAKIQKAFCPPQETRYNPILDYAHRLVLGIRGELVVERSEAHGGTVTFDSYPELEQAYASGALHPADLKNAVASHLIDMLGPARAHFEDPRVAGMLAQLKARLEA
jgi:tyrosyl-tRNA synthetase